MITYVPELSATYWLSQRLVTSVTLTYILRSCLYGHGMYINRSQRDVNYHKDVPHIAEVSVIDCFHWLFKWPV